MREVRIKTEWNEYQDAFLHDPAKHRAMFAEFRSGKTRMAGNDLFFNAFSFNKIHCGVIRNIYQQLIDSTIPQLKEVYDWDLYGGSLNKSTKILELPNGTIIEFFALDRADDNKKLKNVTLGYLFVDQLEEIAEEVFDMAIGRLSQNGAPNRSCSVGNFEGKGWYWDKFFVNPLPGKVHSGIFNKGGQERTRDYGIFSGKNENFVGYWPPPFLNECNLTPPTYYDEQIRSHSTIWNDKYMFGIPTGNAGLLHKDFNEDRHLIRAKDYFIPPVETAWIPFEGMDHGIASPTCWLFVSYHKITDTIYILDEYYESGRSIFEHAPEVKGMRRRYGRPALTTGCPSAFQTEKDGKTPADIYSKKYQIILTPYSVGEDVRIEIINDRFANNKIKIFDRCRNLTSQLTRVTWKNKEDTEDHALEAFHRVVAKIDAEMGRGRLTKNERDAISRGREKKTIVEPDEPKNPSRRERSKRSQSFVTVEF